MRYTIAFLLMTVFLTSSLVGCTKISLSDKGNKGTTGGTSGGGTGGGLQTSAPPAGDAPQMNGEWELTYIVNGQEVLANVTFAQQGNQLTGSGMDASGDEWQLQSGQLDGTKVNFVKKTVARQGQPFDGPPVAYTGEMQYSNDASYAGWMASGTWSLKKADGSEMTGEWLAVPKGGGQQAAAPPPDPGQPIPTPAAPVQAPPPTPIGNVKPSDISGRYAVTYAYNFKKINCKMWLKHDGEPLTKPNLSGDGVDTTTGESFEIPKGWYAYPKITIVRQYTKGKGGAKATRTIVFKGTVSSNGSVISIKGETQFGGQWEGTLKR